MLIVKFTTDNAAFCADTNEEADNDASQRAECARILGKLAEELENGSTVKGSVYDVNGNRVGDWRLEGD